MANPVPAALSGASRDRSPWRDEPDGRHSIAWPSNAELDRALRGPADSPPEPPTTSAEWPSPISSVAPPVSPASPWHASAPLSASFDWNDSLDAPRTDTVQPAQHQRLRRRRGAWSTVGLVAATLLMVGGGALLLATMFAPTAVERTYGEAKVATEQVVRDTVDTVIEEVTQTPRLPQVELGVRGGQTELDWCDWTFIEMASYQATAGVPPVYAAHNGCGGDVILTWEEGDYVQVAGSDAVYQVVEIRNTAKEWVTTDALIGLQGEFALQTCYYGIDQMRFVGLAEVADSTAALQPAHG